MNEFLNTSSLLACFKVVIVCLYFCFLWKQKKIKLRRHHQVCLGFLNIQHRQPVKVLIIIGYYKIFGGIMFLWWLCNQVLLLTTNLIHNYEGKTIEIKQQLSWSSHSILQYWYSVSFIYTVYTAWYTVYIYTVYWISQTKHTWSCWNWKAYYIRQIFFLKVWNP